ncbi:MJ0042-type zinc finger domain-containing protein [Pseudorhodoplanes sp.]|uniref:MJ0042-type zinc finger domain-containing protein n=1 Tax=Pseudorhodoplanes sp. TaxID=1934341 RepID=UPI003919A7B4
MLIVCPHCATSYRVRPESVGENGRKVRCVSCHNVWFEEPRQAAAQAAGIAEPEAFEVPQIRPPLDDVVDIGDPDRGASADPHDPGAGSVPYENAPPIAPGQADAESPVPDSPNNVEKLAARRSAKQQVMRGKANLSRHTLPALICAMGLLLLCLVAARQQIVRYLPQTASLYASIGLPVNLRGLAFANIRTAREVEDGVPLLIVEGDIVGTTGRHTEVPRLRFAVTDAGGKEIYAWTARPARNLLPPGETLPFRSRLASPPAEASGITVRFFNRRDAQAGFM